MPIDPSPSAPTRRFSDRVEFYIRSRPRYPLDVLHFFQRRAGLLSADVVVDVGSGTGMLAELFLDNGNLVYCVEPNDEMRAAAQTLLGDRPNFHSIHGAAEATSLPGGLARLVVAGQAFHWFDPVATRAEFRRIMQPQGWAGLIWNERRRDDAPFSVEYHRLIEKHSRDHDAVMNRSRHATDPAVLAAFFGPAGYERLCLDNAQSLSFATLVDRMASSSYMPLPDQPGFSELLHDLRVAFDAHSTDGSIRLSYDTIIFAGRMS